MSDDKELNDAYFDGRNDGVDQVRQEVEETIKAYINEFEDNEIDMTLINRVRQVIGE